MSEHGFYVIPTECMACGAPEEVAPDLMGHDDTEYQSCCFLRQPVTPAEVDQAIAAINASCCGAVQYGGNDPVILARIAVLEELGSARWGERQMPLPEFVESWEPLGGWYKERLSTNGRRSSLARQVARYVGIVLFVGSIWKALFVVSPTELGTWLVFGVFIVSILLFGWSFRHR